MIKHGFKRVQKWIFELESAAIQEQMKQDLANYQHTKEMKDWDAFALDQATNCWSLK